MNNSLEICCWSLNPQILMNNLCFQEYMSVEAFYIYIYIYAYFFLIMLHMGNADYTSMCIAKHIYFIVSYCYSVNHICLLTYYLVLSKIHVDKDLGAICKLRRPIPPMRRTRQTCNKVFQTIIC